MADDHQFIEFVRARSAALYGYGYLLTGSHHDADDLVQDALLRLRLHWDRVNRKDDPIGYVRTTMTRLHVSTWRRRRRELLSATVPDKAVDDRELERVDSGDHAAQVWTALGELPRKQRAVLILRYYEHLSDTEIAVTLGVSRETVRSQASRALGKLRAGAASLSLTGESR